MLTQFTKQAAFDSGFERRLNHLVWKEAARREMEKESMTELAMGLGRAGGAAARGIARGSGGIARGLANAGGYIARELPMLPTTLLGHARNLGGQFGEEFGAARAGITSKMRAQRNFKSNFQGQTPEDLLMASRNPAAAPQTHSMSNVWTPPAGPGAPTSAPIRNTTSTAAPGGPAPGGPAPGGSGRFQFSGPHGSTFNPETLDPAIAAAGGEGKMPPAGGSWFQNLMGRAPGVQSFVNKHPMGTGLGAGAAGMYGLNQYSDYKHREAIRNMGGLDRLQAALGLVFSPNEFANRLY